MMESRSSSPDCTTKSAGEKEKVLSTVPFLAKVATAGSSGAAPKSCADAGKAMVAAKAAMRTSSVVLW